MNIIDSIEPAILLGIPLAIAIYGICGFLGAFLSGLRGRDWTPPKKLPPSTRPASLLEDLD